MRTKIFNFKINMFMDCHTMQMSRMTSMFCAPYVT